MVLSLACAVGGSVATPSAWRVRMRSSQSLWMMMMMRLCGSMAAYCRPLPLHAHLPGGGRTTRSLATQNKPPLQGVLRLWGELLRASAASSTSELAAASAPQWAEAEALIKDQLRAFQGHVDGALLPEQVHQSLMQFYSGLEPAKRSAFLLLMAQQLSVQEEDVNGAIHNWQQVLARTAAERTGGSHSSTSATASGSGSDALLRAAECLRVASQPLYSQLFGPISREPDGIPFLVTLRSHVRAALSQQPSFSAPLRALDDQLKQALSSWFTPGLLECRMLTWETTPGVLLGKLQQYEAVHAIEGFEDMRRRMGADRRVHAYFHPCLPGEPLVILHAALMDHVPGNMDEVLDTDVGPAGCNSSNTTTTTATTATTTSSVTRTGPPAVRTSSPGAPCGQPTVAAFYSISSTQPGLAGVDLGHFLIMQVAKKIQAELPCVQQLVTLSPLPGFRSWLKSKLTTLALEERQAAARAPPSPPPPSPPPSPPLPSSAAVAAATAASFTGGGSGPQEWVSVRPNAYAAPPLLTPDEAEAVAAAAEHGLLSEEELRALRAQEGDAHGGAGPGYSGAGRVLAVLEAGRWLAPPGGVAQAAGAAGGSASVHPAVQAALPVLRRVLLRAAARYLVLERRRNLALDSVAHFHLRNGAQLMRINYGADWRPGGMERSYGVMVNYHYDLAAAHANNQGYLMDYTIETSPSVLQLLL